VIFRTNLFKQPQLQYWALQCYTNNVFNFDVELSKEHSREISTQHRKALVLKKDRRDKKDLTVDE